MDSCSLLHMEPSHSPSLLLLQLDNLLLHCPATGGPPQLKLCDFGLSKDEVASAPKSSCGTPEYMAPEVRPASEPAAFPETSFLKPST